MVGNDYTATDPVVFGGDYEEWTFTTSTMYYLGFNAASGPMQNPNLRRAIDMPLIGSISARLRW